MSSPQTSIVIRTLNEEKHIGRLLEGIQQQTHRDWEVVLIDSGSTDRTVEVASRYTQNIFHIPKEEFTFGRSLNLGCQQAKGEYLVFVSAHIYPLTNTWLDNLVRPFEDPRVGMVYGAQRVGQENSVAEERAMLYNFGNTSRVLIDEPAGHNGNSAVRRNLWLDQPFDEQLTGLEDIEWAKRIQQKGFRVYYAADARVVHIHEESLRQVYRRFFREALAYKSIFPAYRLSRPEAVKQFVYCLAGDVLFAFRHRKPMGKMLRVLPERTAEWLAKYRGNHYHRTLRQDLARRLRQPQSYGGGATVGASGPDALDGNALELNPDEVLVQVAYLGVDPSCSSNSIDNSVATRGLDAGNSTKSERSYSGVVVQCGERVQQFQPGHKVVGNLSGAWANGNACPSYLRVPINSIHQLPDEVLLREASAIGPLVWCIQTLREKAVQPGKEACVIGAGPTGNLMAQLLANRGVRVTVCDPNQRRLSLLWKYNINTLPAPESLEKFECVIDTTSNSTGAAPWSDVGDEPNAFDSIASL